MPGSGDELALGTNVERTLVIVGPTERTLLITGPCVTVNIIILVMSGVAGSPAR